MRLKERIYSVEGFEALELPIVLSYVYLVDMVYGTNPARYHASLRLDRADFGPVFERLNMFLEVP